MEDITFETFNQLIKADLEGIILDVRTPEEFEMGHLENALNINFYDYFIEKIENLDKNKNYYVYCAGGGRSKTACGILETRVRGKIYNLYEGFNNYPDINKINL